jgi:hypothetical protein
MKTQTRPQDVPALKDLAPPPERRRIPAGFNAAGCVLPRDLAGMPPAVAEANAKVWELIDRQRDLDQQYRTVKAEAAAAPAHDRNAATAAAAAGEEPPPAITPIKLKAKSDLEDQRNAVESATAWATYALADAIRPVRDEWYHRAVEEAENAKATTNDQLDELRNRFVQGQAQTALVSALRGFDGTPGSIRLGSSSRDPLEHLAQMEAAKLAKWHGNQYAPRRGKMVQFEEAELFAAMRLLLDKGAA